MTDAMRMDEHEALDEVRAQKERLEEELRIKVDLYNLEKVHNELVMKLQDARLQSEKQAQELSAKSEELSTLNQLHQDLKSSFHEKESSLRQLNSANEKLRFDSREKIQKLQEENKNFILALDEATATIQSLASKVCAGNKEIEDLKRVLSVKDKKLLETAERAETNKDLMQRDDVIRKLEEDHRDIQDQLKWKNEQFHHLEEAHERLQDNFQSSRTEWEREKAALLEEISLLQTNLDSQIRVSESLQTQLTMCNQALAHEESTRKLLEVEVSEYKLRFENVFSECQDAKDKIEKLSLKRDEEVVRLRNNLASKDSLSKEMEYKMVHLEQENRDIKASLREFQEAQIATAGTTCSMKKLQRKYQGLEQLHRKCDENFKLKELEWKSQVENVKTSMDGYLSKLKVQGDKVKQLQDELENCNCLLKFQSEEMSSVIQLVLNSKFSVAYSELVAAVSALEQRQKESEDMILHLTEQLEIKNNSLHEVHAKLSKKCEKVASLMEKVELFDNMKQHHIFLEEELQSHKKMAAGLSEYQLLVEEQAKLLENSQKKDGNADATALEVMISELAQKVLELEKGKSVAENQIIHLEARLEACKTESTDLLCSLKEQNEKICHLQQQIVLLEMLVTEKTESIEALKREKENYFQVIEDEKRNTEDLLIVYAQEKKSLLGVIEGRDQRIVNLEEQAKVLEQSMTNAFMKFKEKQTEMDVLTEAFHESQYQSRREIDEKNREAVKLEVEVSDLCEKLKVKDESLFQFSKKAEKLQVLLERNKLETEKLVDQFGNEKRHLQSVVKNLQAKKEAMLVDIRKLSSDREDLLMQMDRLCKQIDGLSCNDVELMGMLENILQNSNGEKGILSLPFSPPRKGKEETIDARLPLLELNK